MSRRNEPTQQWPTNTELRKMLSEITDYRIGQIENMIEVEKARRAVEEAKASVFGAASQPEKEAELAQLRKWKQEALEVMSGLQDLGRELGLRPGEQITGPAAIEAIKKLKKETA